MNRLAALLLLILSTGGCASMPDVADMPEASAADLIGTWSDMRTVETFLPDGTYCSSPAGTGAVRTVGTWYADTPGHLAIGAARPLDPAQVDENEVVELSIVRIPKPGRLYIGTPCFHCLEPLGSVFHRSWPARTSCAMPTDDADD